MADYPGIDDAWQTRLPPGWKIFPDGSPGPANTSSPIDSAWPTRLPGSPYGPPPETSLSGPGGGPASAAGGALTARPYVPNPYGASMPRGTGPDIMSPSSQPLRPGMSPTVRNGPGPYIDATVNKGGDGDGILGRLRGWIPGILGAAGPAAVPALAAGGAAAGVWAEPRTPRVDPRISAAGTGGFDVEQPLGRPMPQRPISRPTQWPDSTNYPQYVPPPPVTNRPQDRPSYAGPVVAQPTGTNRPQDRPSYAGPVVAPSAAAVPQKPNLGYYQMPQPNIDPLSRGGRRGGDAPMMGVLGWDPNGPLFGRGG